jgi:hypothetical protein
MVQLLAVTEAVKSLSVVEAEFGLRLNEDEDFFFEWVVDLPGRCLGWSQMAMGLHL